MSAYVATIADAGGETTPTCYLSLSVEAPLLFKMDVL